MALPSNDKIIGDLGHTADHNAIVDEITFIKENYLSASAGTLDDFLRKDAASATYATIVSPEFSGIPVAPTAASGTNTSQIATTQFVRSEVSALVDSAPSTLDTLNELAAALGDDPNFATTVTQSLSNKLDSSTASATYLKQDSASATYLRRDTAAATYLPISASSNYLFVDAASATYLRQDSASVTYLTQDTASSLYFPKSASGSLLTEEEASAIYLPISASFNPEGYLTSSAAAEMYLTIENASATYLPISASANFGGSGSVDLSSYLTIEAASETYLPISASSLFSTVGYLTASAAEILYASLVSPVFSGSPTTPTPPTGTNNNQIATTAFVSDAILAVQSGSAVDLSAYLRADTASATYLSKNDVIDGGTP